MPVASLLFAAGVTLATAQDLPVGNAERGKQFFQSTCAICHSDALGQGNTLIIRQGPTLLGIMGRKAGNSPHFNYTQALKDSGMVWDTASLDHFLTDPMKAVPGTAMPIPLSDPAMRADLIAYLATLKIPPGITLDTANFSVVVTATPGIDPSDWQRATPGVKHHLTTADLPAPFATPAAGNGPKVVPAPANAAVSVPPGFTVKQFASGLNNPRLLRVAPNGDIFISETGRNRVRVLRAADGSEAPAENQIFVEGLDRPFGLAFYPQGDNPKWLYIANINSVVRVPYQKGDLKASAAPEVIIPKLSDTTGGHSTRDVVFSKNGKRMFISVGSGSNIAEEMKRKTPDEIKAWEAEHGLGATWGPESNRANILVTDPEGHAPLHPFATGIRNGVGMAINPTTGELWVSTNERDGLGDNLVPDYVTSVKEGGYYGWPWYYMGNFEDPRHPGERLDLAGKAIVPDVLEQSHSASLEMTFYTATKGVAAFPAEYRGDAFVALHGSWNRATRTGYKLVRVRLKKGRATGEYDDFMTGFVVDDAGVWGRPVGVTVAHDGALLVTEDGHGTIWRIAYTGSKSAGL